MKVSIIIRTKNEGRILPEVLSRIRRQACDEEVEIIVVDSGSSDNTVSCAREFNCQVILLPESSFTFGRAINEGVKKAGGEIIVLLSGHALPADKKWLRELLEGFTNIDVAAIFSRQIPLRGYDPFEEWQFRRNFPAKVSPLRSLALRGDAFSNASCAIRREILIRFPFEEKLSGSEDREWAGRVKKNGFKISYNPASCVYHSHRLFYKAIYERKFIQAKARKMIYPDSCRYDNIFWLGGAFVAAILIDLGYCLYRGYFRFLPKAFTYRSYYFRGLIDGVKAARREKNED